MALDYSEMESRIKPETIQVPVAHVSLPCSAGADCVWVLERADRMLSGVISTLERIFARGL